MGTIRLMLCKALLIVFSATACAMARGPAASVGEVGPLPALGVREVSVAGLSSGAFMSVQLVTIHSARISSGTFFAGGVFGCAEGRPDRAVTVCMGAPEKIDVASMIKGAQYAAGSGAIDGLASMHKGRYTIVQGDVDPVVKPAAGEKLREFFKGVGANATLLEVEGLGHGIPSPGAPVPCSESRAPWMNDCQVSGPIETFRSIRGFVDDGQPGSAHADSLRAFSQKPYGSEAALMADEGHLYAPLRCRQAGAGCPLLVVLHGCAQDPSIAGASLVRDGGFNALAEKTGAVVLYPAAKKGMTNPQGCWDWWGYTGKGYATKSGPQVKAIMAMIEALSLSTNVSSK